MSITDELREFARRWPCTDYIHKDMLAIADRIDAEHERQLGVLYRDMSDAEWVRLPVDADGKPIHVGDVMAYKDNTKPMQVVALMPPSVFMVEDGPRFADMCRHYHVLTVSDVLRGVVELCHNTWKKESAFEFYDVDDVMKSGNIADFAAKLRLADDEEEQ